MKERLKSFTTDIIMTGMNQAPEISVGIVSGSGLTFTLNGQLSDSDAGRKLSGRWTLWPE